MNLQSKSKGPRTVRFLVFLITVLVGLLFYWLLGFFLKDLGALPPPAYDAVEQRYLDPAKVTTHKDLERELTGVRRQITNQQERQRLLRDSISSSQTTINQLLDIQKLSLQKGVALTEAQQKAFAENQDLFLTNQTRYQLLNEDVARLSEQQRQLEERQRELDTQLADQRTSAQQEYAQISRRHSLKIAALKLAVLIPILLMLVWLFFRHRTGLYAAFIYAGGIAVLWKVGVVIHEHFPSKFFKYILLLVALGILSQLLVWLLRSLAFPKKESLLKQYREAYEKFLCPACGFPIRRGPMKYLAWGRSGPRSSAAALPSGPVPDRAYSCPACGESVFEECPSCHGIRHSRLPACENCGARKEVA